MSLKYSDIEESINYSKTFEELEEISKGRDLSVLSLGLESNTARYIDNFTEEEASIFIMQAAYAGITELIRRRTGNDK